MGIYRNLFSYMKTLLTEDWVVIPEGVTCTVKSRIVTIKGPRGENRKDFSHLNCEIQRTKTGAKGVSGGQYLRIRMWFGGYKQACAVNTLKSHITNMCIGITEGFQYKMRCVHAHFPINCIVPKDGSCVDIKNFIGGKQIHHIQMIKGVTVRLCTEVKDQLIFEGADNGDLSLCCARVSRLLTSAKRMSVSSSMVSSSPRRLSSHPRN